MPQDTDFDIVDGLDEPSTRTGTSGSTVGSTEPPSRIDRIPSLNGFETVRPHDLAGIEPEWTPGTYSPGPVTGNGPETKRRPGRPAGSKNAPKLTSSIPSPLINGLESILLSVHAMGAAILTAPEWELDKSEAKSLADGINEVGKYYDMTVDPKKMAIINLSVIAGGIYAPRLIATFRTISAKPKGPQLVKQPKAEPEPIVTQPPVNGGIRLTPSQQAALFTPPSEDIEH